MEEEEEEKKNVFLFDNFNLKPLCRRLFRFQQNAALELPFLWHE